MTTTTEQKIVEAITTSLLMTPDKWRLVSDGTASLIKHAETSLVIQIEERAIYQDDAYRLTAERVHVPIPDALADEFGHAVQLFVKTHAEAAQARAEQERAARLASIDVNLI